MMKHLQPRAYTLVETLIAIGIMSLLMLSVTSFITGMLSGERHTRAIAEVEAQGQYITYVFAQAARNASSISTPATSTASTLVVLAAPVAASTTTFALSGDTILMKQGSGATTTLTSSTVSATNLTFTNISSTTARVVRMQLTLAYENPNVRADAAFSRKFSTTVTLR